MKNLYKNMDVFKCMHESHKGYKNNISVYHILKEKSCWPEGCIYFRWKCKILNKKSKCPRRFSHVGRKCFGCREFYEEKIHNYPELQLSKENYREFLNDLDEFEDWLAEFKYKPISFWGKVSSIKPNFVQKVGQKSKFLSFQGYIITLKEVYLDNQNFEDPLYLLISSYYYAKFHFGIGGEIEGFGQLITDRGRLVLKKIKNVEINHSGQPPFWNDEKVTITRNSAVELGDQPRKCIECPFGTLVEQKFYENMKYSPRRKLFCLKGLAGYRDCYVPIEYFNKDEDSKS